jgi:predicted DCC family thiol-disulfide oxidoreductase YuxK
MARPVSQLSPEARAALGGYDVVVFDGECVLCSGFFRFATAQSPLGQRLYADLGLPTDAFETNLVIVDGRIHERLPAFAAAMSALGWPWRAFAAARWVPEPLSSALYHAIARNRYRLFGRHDHCMVPTAELRVRFLDLSRAT